MKGLDKLTWTFVIRLTKLEKLIPKKIYHAEISQAYQREFDRRKKIFDDSMKGEL